MQVESALTGFGRIHGTWHDAVVRTAVLAGRPDPIDRVNGSTPIWPGDERVYIYGSLFLDWVRRTYGDSVPSLLVNRTAGAWLPPALFFDRIPRRMTGHTFTNLYDVWLDSLRADHASLADSLARVAGLLIGLQVIAAAATWIQTVIMVHVSQKSVRDLRKDLFDRLQALSLRFFDTRPHGDVMSRLTNDTETVSNTLGQSVTQLISSVLAIAGSAVGMLWLNWRPLLAAKFDQDADRVSAGAYDLTALNGFPNQYDSRPIELTAGQRARFWVLNVGPDNPVSFHIVGGIFDTVFSEGAYPVRNGLTEGTGAQVLPLLPAQGGFVEVTFDEPGTYTFVNHIMTDAEKGQHGTIIVR